MAARDIGVYAARNADIATFCDCEFSDLCFVHVLSIGRNHDVVIGDKHDIFAASLQASTELLGCLRVSASFTGADERRLKPACKNKIFLTVNL